ncbi:glycoside hydrolase family 25 protein [Pedosphaera parvula]|uniref:Lysozyme n=1 Tax=Pedosphaera parvula (strain Ellin514) TaxID=320771 RepID=B9XDV4_PEDPL|nr:glycoside hydrolase family 25 protein [Pedosphaera parvula]EEF61845.1 glycoside hydrolase family 25 [Pedosphaera parvula Ellin514]
MKASLKTTVMKSSLALAAAVAMSVGSQSAQANNLLGIDVSSYQGSPNWTSVAGCGPKYAFVKATEGNYYQDSVYNSDMSNGKAAGLQMGAYDFCRPDQISPATEANYFWAFAGSKITTDGKSLYPMADFEVFGGHVGATTYTAWFNAWSADVKAKKTTFMHPVIYCSAGTGACDLNTGITLSAWIANYNGGNLYTGHPWTCCTSCNAWGPGTGNNWTYWQVSSTGAICGISGNVDLDAYPLSLSELIAYQGL